jgi:type VI secretion system protein ImpJ
MPRKPLWTEGLLVSQHHFQLQDLYHEALVRERVSAIRRFDWGILELEVDEALLRAGQFKLRRLVAVLPDGMVVRCGGASEDPPPEARSFEEVFGPEMQTLDVVVGLSSENALTGNVAAASEAAANRRFARGIENVADYNTGGAAQDVDVALPNLRIFFGPERRDRVLSLQVAQLVRQAGGQVILRDNYVPPVLHVSAAPFLRYGLRRVLEEINTLQRKLAAERRQKTAVRIEFHDTDARRFWLLHTLNGAIPELTHLLEEDATHPEEYYIALSQLFGQLCTFAPDVTPDSLARFNYNKLGEVFEQVFARIRSLLFAEVTPAYVEIPLTSRPDGMFVGKIPEANLLNHEFFVAVKSTLPEATVRERVPRLLKIADWNHILDIATQAAPGIRVEVVFTPSTVLPLKPGLCFFRLRREGQFWDHVVRTLTLALFMPGGAESRETMFSVYAVDPQHLR